MSTHTRYFRSQKYTAEEEASESQALASGTYVRVAYLDHQPQYAEVFSRGELKEVVYYGHEPLDSDFARARFQEHGRIPVTIYGLPTRDANGEWQTFSGWNPKGALFHVTRRLVDDRGEPLQEEVRDGAGALLGVRRFEYHRGELSRVIFTRPDGAEIIELEDWSME
jgi:hypothetical protein